MPLSIQNKPVEPSDLFELDVFLEKYGDFFADTAQSLKNTSVCQVTKDQPCLFIGQCEIGSTGVFDDDKLHVCGDPYVYASRNKHVIKCRGIEGPNLVQIKMLGTDMMTTCHAAVLRCPITSATSLGHFDGSSTETGILEMVLAVHKISLITHPKLADCKERQFELHLVGGFNDDRELSSDLSLALLNGFQHLNVEFCSKLQIDLLTFCCSSMNTTTVTYHHDFIESPVIFGLGVYVSSGHIFPLAFKDNARQPGEVIRGARTFHGHVKMKNMYRWDTKTIVIEPFTYKPFSSAAKWLEAPDNIIREHMSTSPEVEPSNFVAHMRQSLHFIVCNPDPLVSIFAERKPIQYKISNKEWKKLTS